MSNLSIARAKRSAKTRRALLVACFLFFSLFFTALNANACININTAPQEELEKIKHIGESRAKQIITLRGEKLFASVDELDRVVGIGPARVADIKTEGLACVEEEKTTTDPLLEIRPPIEIGSQSIVEPKQPVVYPSNIVINEIMPSPDGADETGEWIKILNKNDFEADLSGWQIADTIGKTSAYTIPAGTKISARGFLIFKRQETKIILNNGSDGLNLIQPNGQIADSVSYEKAVLGQSYGPGAAKIISAATIEPAPSFVGTTEDEAGLAAISGPFDAAQGKRNFYPFLAAFSIAILSGFVILLLKYVRT